ncbi:MAG: putative transposase/invertase (TIGR01784 family) [Phenylobacterium sp.]|jgi:predicted transposase/invertase (TIGR01784 family)
MKFLDIRTDFAFKKVFGSKESKPRLISFLNSILDFDDDSKIADLTIADPYNIPKLKGMKDTYVDVKAELTDGTSVIIEMQMLNHPGFEKRVLYNAAKNYSMQLVKGQRYDLLKPVIALNIVNFNMFDDSSEMISAYKLLNKKDFSDYNDDIELIFIELNKFTKTKAQCQGIQDDWIYFVKNAGEMSNIPENLPQQVQSAYEVSNEAGMTKEELEIQDKKREWIAIQVGSLVMAEQKGEAKGIEIGEAKGLEIGKAKGIEIGEAKGIEIGEAKGIEIGEAKGIEIGEMKKAKAVAIKLFLAGMTDDKEISDISGLPVDEVTILRASQIPE